MNSTDFFQYLANTEKRLVAYLAQHEMLPLLKPDDIRDGVLEPSCIARPSVCGRLCC